MFKAFVLRQGFKTTVSSRPEVQEVECYSSAETKEDEQPKKKQVAKDSLGQETKLIM